MWVTTMISTLASLAAAAMVVRSIIRDYLPDWLEDYMYSGLEKLFSKFLNQHTMVIHELDGLESNDMYEAAQVYLGSKITTDTRRTMISKRNKEKHFNLKMEHNEEVIDTYKGEKFRWIWLCKDVKSTVVYDTNDMNLTKLRSFELIFQKRNMDLVINSYLPYIIHQSLIRKHERKTIKIFTVNQDRGYKSDSMWQSICLAHPSTLETLALDADQKEMILNDLDRFLKRRDHYRKIGKVWKRGYLLYGPPGTGKSSLIAAMANYLNFDIYDLEMTQVRTNSELRKLLISTANKSILVVEDIDCTVDLHDREANSPPRYRDPHESRVTLSGFLNFIDGLWSSCGDERIIIFTTNHVEKLDPALLRPGRMDVHINMSYCNPCGFKVLAANYLGLKDHLLFPEIQNLIKTVEVTPAEVAEQLLKSDVADSSLQELIGFIHSKKRKIEEAEAKRAEEESSGKKENAERAGQSQQGNDAEEN